MSLSTIADATNAVNRLTDVFTAETFGETQIHDHHIEEALVAEKASFSWDSPPQEEEQLDYEDDGEGDIRSDVQEGSNVTRTIPIETTGAVSRLHHTVPEARLTFA